MDFQSAMETFAEAWVEANSNRQYQNGPQSEALALTTKREERAGQDGGSSPERAPPPGSPVARSTPQHPPPPPSHPDLQPDARNPAARSLPVHCIVETVWNLDEWEQSSINSRGHAGSLLEVDSYVIIPVATPFQELVPAALHRLGYSNDNVPNAKGSVIIKNWKPLSFEKIAESPLMTVGDILGELSTVATLRIQIFRPKPSSLAEMKDKLLRLLLLQSHSMLASSGCPLDEVTLSQMVRGGVGTEPSDEMRRRFEGWWSGQVEAEAASARRQWPWYHPQGIGPIPPGHLLPPNPLHTAHPDRKHPLATPDQPVKHENPDHLHPALQTVQNQYPTTKTRMRTSFDPELELPKLQKWFFENRHPSRQQIQQYVKELNSLESRRGRKTLDINNVVYWFKNARAAQKRAEIRSLMPGLHLSLNGYNSNSSGSPSEMVMKSPGSTNREEEEFYDEEKQSGRASPQGPLSLTTRESTRSPSPSRTLPQGSQSPHSDEREKDDLEEKKAVLSTPGADESIVNNNNNNEPNVNNVDNDNNNTINKDEVLEDDDEDLDEGVSDTEENKDDKAKLVRSLDLFRGGPGSNFPMVPTTMFSQSIMYMSHYLPGLNQNNSHTGGMASPQGLNLSSLADERRKRNRTFIDPVSEVPRLEQWFAINTHPSHNLILKYTDDLNRMPYRQKFPPLEPKNVQFWFKNRRAKCKRLKMSLFDSPGGVQASQSYHGHHQFGSPLAIAAGGPPSNLMYTSDLKPLNVNNTM